MSVKNIFIGKKVKYTDEHNLYTLQMVHRRFPWWILLLLLIPLLFIRCNKNLAVVCTDNGKPVVNEEVQLHYTSYYFLSKKAVNDAIDLTDSLGEAHFRIKCSVYSYIFHCMARGYASADIRNIEVSKSFYYHFTRKVHLALNDDTEDMLVKDDDELPKPTENCGVHFSGIMLSDEEEYDAANDPVASIIFGNDPYGEYVGQGYYPDNTKTFPKAVEYTFDAIAVDKGTHLIIYSKPNFKGKVLLDVVGPVLIFNGLWIDDFRYNHIATKTFSPTLQAMFPVSRRQWTKKNMHNWSYGSCKIICEQCGK